MFTSDKRLQDQYIPDRNSASATFHIVICLITYVTNKFNCLFVICVFVSSSLRTILHAY
jgi:hypothetical protein